MATVRYLVKIDLARAFVAIALPLGWCCCWPGGWRCAAGWWRSGMNGRLAHRVVVVGDPLAAAGFVARLAEEPAAGFTVVASACRRTPSRSVRTTGADVVRRDGVRGGHPGAAAAAGLELEGTDVDLVVAPAVTDVAGPRITVRPVAGLPLLYVDEPRFTGGARLVKGTIDLLGAALALVLLSPLLRGGRRLASG